jgi:hypothetical protein
MFADVFQGLVKVSRIFPPSPFLSFSLSTRFEALLIFQLFSKKVFSVKTAESKTRENCSREAPFSTFPSRNLISIMFHQNPSSIIDIIATNKTM